MVLSSGIKASMQQLTYTLTNSPSSSDFDKDLKLSIEDYILDVKVIVKDSAKHRFKIHVCADSCKGKKNQSFQL